MAKLPSFQFYPGDWMKDPDLRRCSHSAKGVWIDVLCLAFESGDRGVLISGGEPWSLDDIARAVGGNLDVTVGWLKELLAKGVMRCREDGAYYSKRLVEDEKKRKEEMERKRLERSRASPESVRELSEQCPEMSQPSSSSTSPSTSSSILEDLGRAKKKVQVSCDFAPDQELLEWALREGFTVAEIARETPAMIDHFRGEGKPKKDWRATWRNWMRNSLKYKGKNRNGTHGRESEQIAENLRVLGDFAKGGRQRDDLFAGDGGDLIPLPEPDHEPGENTGLV